MRAGIRLGDQLRDDAIAVRLTPPLEQVVFGAPAYSEAGRLEVVLEPYAIERPGYFLYSPRSHSRIDRLRVFADFFRFRGDGAF